MNPFLIVGLPRSRTAWWSVVTTTPGSICHHEPLKNCMSFEDLRLTWDHPCYEATGISDSGLTYVLGRVLAEIEPRTLLIERDADQVEHSLCRRFAGQPIDRLALRRQLLDMATRLNRWRDHALVKAVRFEALKDVGTVEQCFDWLLPKCRHGFRRELMDMNIQVDADHALAEMRKPHSRWYLEV